MRTLDEIIHDLEGIQNHPEQSRRRGIREVISELRKYAKDGNPPLTPDRPGFIVGRIVSPESLSDELKAKLKEAQSDPSTIAENLTTVPVEVSQGFLPEVTPLQRVEFEESFGISILAMVLQKTTIETQDARLTAIYKMLASYREPATQELTQKTAFNIYDNVARVLSSSVAHDLNQEVMDIAVQTSTPITSMVFNLITQAFLGGVKSGVKHTESGELRSKAGSVGNQVESVPKPPNGKTSIPLIPRAPKLRTDN